jgi:hypothetical protein
MLLLPRVGFFEPVTAEHVCRTLRSKTVTCEDRHELTPDHLEERVWCRGGVDLSKNKQMDKAEKGDIDERRTTQTRTYFL